MIQALASWCCVRAFSTDACRLSSTWKVTQQHVNVCVCVATPGNVEDLFGHELFVCCVRSGFVCTCKSLGHLCNRGGSLSISCVPLRAGRWRNWGHKAASCFSVRYGWYIYGKDISFIVRIRRLEEGKGRKAVEDDVWIKTSDSDLSSVLCDFTFTQKLYKNWFWNADLTAEHLYLHKQNLNTGLQACEMSAKIKAFYI